MRVSSRRIAGFVLGVALLPTLVGCNDAVKGAASDAASAGVSAAASAAASKAAEAIPTDLPSSVTSDMLKSVLPLPMRDNITQAELVQALKDGILVRTMNGGDCQSSSSDPNVNTEWVSVVGFKPGVELAATVQPQANPSAKPDTMQVKTDQQGLGILSFRCPTAKGTYVVSVGGRVTTGGDGIKKRPLTVG